MHDLKYNSIVCRVAIHLIAVNRVQSFSVNTNTERSTPFVIVVKGTSIYKKTHFHSYVLLRCNSFSIDLRGDIWCNCDGSCRPDYSLLLVARQEENQKADIKAGREHIVWQLNTCFCTCTGYISFVNLYIPLLAHTVLQTNNKLHHVTLKTHEPLKRNDARDYS